MKPIKNKVLVTKEVIKDMKKEGSLFIPLTVEEYNQPHPIGFVHSTGELCNSVKTGDKIMYNKNSGTDIKIDGVDYTMIFEDNILLILE